MLIGSDISDTVDILRRRNIRFYHACQLKDFRAYLKLGGVPSRALLENSGEDFTPFVSDAHDRERGVWDKVFGNLTDFGLGFAKFGGNTYPPSTPNPYGPILLSFSSECFNELDDLAICLRSASGSNFDREAESLACPADVERIFENEYKEGGGFENSYIKYSDALRNEFNGQYGITSASPPTLNIEVSGSVQTQKISFSHLCGVVVENIDIGSISLHTQVRSSIDSSGLGTTVSDRNYKADRGKLMQDLGRYASEGIETLAQLDGRDDLSDLAKAWSQEMKNKNLEYQVQRVMRYLLVGTMSC